jgi:hypothetical protein
LGGSTAVGKGQELLHLGLEGGGDAGAGLLVGSSANQPTVHPTDHPATHPPQRYLLRVTVTGKGMVADTKRDFPFWVRNYGEHEEEAPPIKVRRGHRFWGVGGP